MVFQIRKEVKHAIAVHDCSNEIFHAAISKLSEICINFEANMRKSARIAGIHHGASGETALEAVSDAHYV